MFGGWFLPRCRRTAGPHENTRISERPLTIPAIWYPTAGWGRCAALQQQLTALRRDLSQSLTALAEVPPPLGPLATLWGIR